MMDIEQFFSDQLSVWDDARRRYADLQSAEHKTVTIGGRDYDVMFNPARMKSAMAKVVDGRVERPCFLCADALPAEQRKIRVEAVPSGRAYDIMVNPYPIVDRHFTLVSTQHERQDLADASRHDAFASRVWDMAFFADLLPDYLIFFNGACSGASAPDHLHFQAVPKSSVPLTHWTWAQQQDMGVTSAMPQQIADSDHCNVVCWTEGAECHWLVIERKCHRPKEYGMTGEGQVLISPAALEFCGLVPMARREDYDKMDAALLGGILGQCRRQQPMLHVGIVEGEQIRFSADERTHSLNYVADGRMLHVMDYGTNRAEKEEITEYCTTSSPFTLEGVTIGKQFHWQQKEDQTFVGSLRVIARDGQLHAINIVPVEEYLKSVISSEMSATNNLELLKTHAIISRSWVLRQIACKKGAADCNRVVADDRAVIFWDHSDHTLFDVCADDHCQRYQGITRQVSPLVAQAIDETRGMVLLDRDGQICDARFSKCCGGKSELFSTCWQDEDFHYLQPVDDPWCDTNDERVLRLVLNDYDQRTIDFHDWTVTYTEAELTELVNRKLSAEIAGFHPFGRVVGLVPESVGPSGRISLLRIDGTSAANGKPQSFTIGKELLIRKALSETHLYSSAFTVRVIEASANDPRKFVLTGKGWGHGVGLCQIGAANMSQHGYDFRRILAHYFIGARIESVY